MISPSSFLPPSLPSDSLQNEGGGRQDALYVACCRRGGRGRAICGRGETATRGQSSPISDVEKTSSVGETDLFDPISWVAVDRDSTECRGLVRPRTNVHSPALRSAYGRRSPIICQLQHSSPTNVGPL